jgi:hypothetical protein
LEGQVATSVFSVEDQTISPGLISWRCWPPKSSSKLSVALARPFKKHPQSWKFWPNPFELGQTLCGIATRRNLCRRGWSPDARFRVFVHEHLESVAHDHSRW